MKTTSAFDRSRTRKEKRMGKGHLFTFEKGGSEKESDGAFGSG